MIGVETEKKMRLIDRDEMLSPKIWDMNIPNDVPKVVHDSLFELYDRLIHIPTVDAEPVVRCKDCVYAKPFNKIWQLPKMDTLVCTYFENEEVDENFFCGCAIKKMDEVEE